jgi:hypothetical protein
LGYRDAAIGDHSLASDGKQAIDCGNGEVVDIDTATINIASILTLR